MVSDKEINGLRWRIRFGSEIKSAISPTLGYTSVYAKSMGSQFHDLRPHWRHLCLKLIWSFQSVSWCINLDTHKSSRHSQSQSLCIRLTLGVSMQCCTQSIGLLTKKCIPVCIKIIPYLRFIPFVRLHFRALFQILILFHIYF